MNNNDPEQAEQIQYYLYYVEGSLQPPLLFEFILSKAKQVPMIFPISYIAGKVTDKISEKYSGPELKSNLDFIEGEIKKNDGYLVGGKLSAADILMSFPMEMGFARNFATKEEYPHIQQWLKTLTSLDSYASAKEKAKANGSSF